MLRLTTTTPLKRALMRGPVTSLMRPAFRTLMSSPGNDASVIRLQLDYFMSSQFAGVAVALQDKLYSKAGLTVEVLPNVDPGEEPASVLEAQDQAPGTVCVGTIEQNVLFPCVVENGAKVTTVAAMFGRSPLGIASLKGDLTASHVASTQGQGLTIGAHVDSVDLLQRIMPKARVLGVARDEKLSLLSSGDIDAVQIYDVMEPLALEAKFGKAPAVIPLGDCTSSLMELGYAQVIFVPTSLLKDATRKASLKKFLEVTFAGWKQAIADPQAAAKAVMNLQPTEVDHWVEDLKFTTSTVERCNDYVKMSRVGPSLGVVDPSVWETANKWFAAGSKSTPDASRYPPLDTSVWGVDPKLMVGDSLARNIVNGVRRKGQAATTQLGRQPSLAVITLGEEPVGGTHHSAQRRLQLYAPKDQSWFNKTGMGNALGIKVEEIILPATTTNAQLIAELRKHGDKDGIQLMWPLPSHIDAVAAYSVIRPDQDVDGAFYVGRMELAGGQTAAKRDPSLLLKNAPVTPSAVVRLLDHYGLDVRAKKVVVVGRSRLVGQPLAYMLMARGALVTMVHTDIPHDALAPTCKEADILVASAGHVGLITPDCVKAGAVVINVGTTFLDDALHPDIPKELAELPQAKLVASCPGGVGPLSAAVLFDQVADSALAKAGRPIGATDSTPAVSEVDLKTWLENKKYKAWTVTNAATGNGQALVGTFCFPSFSVALGFIDGLGEEAERANHHPNLILQHHCTAGATVKVEFFSLSTGTITDFDVKAAEVAQTFYNTLMGSK